MNLTLAVTSLLVAFGGAEPLLIDHHYEIAVLESTDGFDHVFVSLQERSSGVLIAQQTWGWYPTGAGTLLDDSFERLRAQRFADFQVSKAEFNRALAAVKTWAAPGIAYQVIGGNCMNFVSNLLSFAGLEVPSGQYAFEGLLLNTSDFMDEIEKLNAARLVAISDNASLNVFAAIARGSLGLLEQRPFESWLRNGNEFDRIASPKQWVSQSLPRTSTTNRSYRSLPSWSQDTPRYLSLPPRADLMSVRGQWYYLPRAEVWSGNKLESVEPPEWIYIEEPLR